MSIEKQIVEWIATRPVWQQLLLQEIAAGQSLDKGKINSIVDRLLKDNWVSTSQFKEDDIPSSQSDQKQVVIVKITELEHVNALIGGQELPFEQTGLTVVYGDNASGKSGYARLLKNIVRSRTRDDVLSNVFADDADKTPSGQVLALHGNTQIEIDWTHQSNHYLKNVLFYDEACGDAYVTTEGDIGYRPYSMILFDGLIEACDQIRLEVDLRIRENESGAKKLPSVAEHTKSAAFLSQFSKDTTVEALDSACKLPSDFEQQLQEYLSEEARLRATDPSKEKARLQKKKTKLTSLLSHIECLFDVLGEQHITIVKQIRAELLDRKKAAEIASKRTFDEEPLTGVGTQVWKELWNAAREYSSQYAYSEEEFPHTEESARCVLCQQELGADSVLRLEKFEAFVQDQTQQLLNETSGKWKEIVSVVNAVEVQPTHIQGILEDLAESDSDLVSQVQELLVSFQKCHEQTVTSIENGAWDPPVSPVDTCSTRLKEIIASLSTLSEQIDSKTFEEKLRRVVALKEDLQSKKVLHDNKKTFLEERQRLVDLEKLKSAKDATNTQAISKKATELTRTHVTTVIRDRFTRESERLRLDRVTLEDIGGRKGSLRHQPALLGAVQSASLQQVLSEGEQSALGLAGFFTEAFFDVSKSALVLDDPVCSLDHIRRGNVAKRLAEFAKDRQVIIFTHDISFVIDLRAVAREEGVPFSERTIERLPSGAPGICRVAHPWKAKDVDERLHQLEASLAAIKREHTEWDQEHYEHECSDWAGKLSETWERMITYDIVGQVVDRGTQEVKPRLFRLLAQISEADDTEFQSSYARCSRWARRHDKSPELNYTAPTPKEMNEELQLVRAWYKRVKKYRQSAP